MTTSTIVVDKIKKTIKRQNVVFSILFSFLGFILFSYLFYNFTITKYDGYIVCKNLKIVDIDDISIIDCRVMPGDVLLEGDTLLSFVYVNWLQNFANPNINSAVQMREIEAKLRYERLKSELVYEEQKQDSLYHILKEAKIDLKFGLIKLKRMEEIEWDYFNVLEQIKHIKRLLKIEKIEWNAAIKGLPLADSIEPLAVYTKKERLRFKNAVGDAYKYKRAFTDMKIVEVNKNIGEIAYKKDVILTVYPYNDSQLSDLHIKMLVPSDNLYKIEEGTIMRVFSGDKFITTGKVAFSSSYTQNVEYDKMKIHANKTIVVRLELDSSKILDTKYQIDNLPIVVYHDKWKALNDSNIIRRLIELFN